MTPTQWRATFTGRTKGADGIFYPITTTVEAFDTEGARFALYEHYEHIAGLVLVPITPSDSGDV